MESFEAALEYTLTSSFTYKNFKKLSFLRKSSPVQACRPLQAKFYKQQALLESTRYKFCNNACGKTVVGVRGVFKIYRKIEIKRRSGIAFYTPPLKCGGVLCYTFQCLSVRPCSPFPIDNLSIYSRNFFKFCIHIVIGNEWYGIVNGQHPSIFNRVTALFRIGKMVSGLLFLYCS